MQSFENSPMPTTKRLGVSLNVDTGYKGKRIDSSPPQTPPAQDTRLNKGNIPAPNRALNKQRDTFLDDVTPIDPASNKENDPSRGNARDSHDLSLSPRQITRDSLVDHMLLSLDQFSFGQEGDTRGRQPTVDEEQLYSTFADDEPYQPTSNFAPRGGRVGHTYSYSSDYDQADDASRYSGRSRGRRSNSSSNFQSGLGRINSLRNEGGTAGFVSNRAPVQIPPRGMHSRSGKGSKGSSANSFDLGYSQAATHQRWTHGLAGMSSSFDAGKDRQAMAQNGPAFPYDYDAAPTPTIPGGPRRLRPPSPVMIPQAQESSPSSIQQQQQEPLRSERKRSTKSSKSTYKGKGNAGSSNDGRLDYGLHDNTRELPPLPAFIREPVPSPLGGYGKTSDIPPSSSQSIPQPPKERPGFFRRVFGSSRSSPVVSTPDPPPSHGSSTPTETSNRPSSKTHHIGSQIRPHHLPPPREPPPPPKETTHILSKKPSSFFRRRKKSVAEPEPVPVPLAAPPVLLSNEHDGRTLPSPVSSLRKVMNPYLRTPARSPIDLSHQLTIDRQMNHSPELYRSVRGFSPDYEPDASATIRTVIPNQRDTSEIVPSTSESAQKPFLSAGPTGADGTFLNDASDDAHSNASRSALSNKDVPESDSVRNRTYPVAPTVAAPLVKRDITLGAEYEKAHSKKTPAVGKAEMSTPSPILESPRSQTAPASTQQSAVANGAKDEEWVMLNSTETTHGGDKENRVWLEPSSDEDEGLEDPKDSSLALPVKTVRSSGSTDAPYISATSLPSVQIDDENDSDSPSPRLLNAVDATGSINEPIDNTALTESDRENAKKIYDGNEDFIQKDRAAAWMGEEGIVRARTLVAYFELYDFTNINILAALRMTCGKLVLKAESQQVDRILDGLAQRWCKCNPNHGFKVTDVVHTICYSILLLNTDLHLADIDQKMTRSQFVKNTMPTVRRSVSESAPDAFETRPSVLPGKNSTFDSTKSGEILLKPEGASVDVEKSSWRNSFRPPPKFDVEGGTGSSPTPLDYDSPQDDCGPLVKAPFHGTLRTWEVQVEIVLKDFYNSIRSERLPLFGAPVEKPHLQAPSSNSLSVFANGVLRRTPSVLSKTPSEAQSNYVRGRTADTVRTGKTQWGNKNRSRPRLYPNGGMGSSRTSLDDQSSMWSPSVSSSTWSKYSLGKTQTSTMSVDSLGSNFPQGDYQQSIGFANALSQAIIREEAIGSAGSNGSDREEVRVSPLLEDESLELAGSPWAKEGIVKHKHHLEALDKKAKDRNWNEVFAVVEKGYLSLFSFSSKSMRHKSKAKATGGVVGGGNWQENAQNLGSFLLRQTIASALPSPGYSKARPHVWALSLPTGAVHLFQVGTPDIVKEFVSTANYWSARLSNHPLVGGISNIEYGWSESIVNNAMVTAINDSTAPRSSTSGHRPSMQSSLRSRSSIDHGMGGVRSRLPGDRIAISDWSPPTQSMRASNLMETDQLQTLVSYVDGIEDELQKHNQLRSPMLLAFTPRHPNSQKAMANWEKKSSYLLREIVKFRTYIDCLNTAQACKKRVYAEREAHRAVVEDDDEGDTTLRPE